MSVLSISGYRRSDGGVGIRNHVAVIYTVDAGRNVTSQIARGDPDAHVFGKSGEHANSRVFQTLLRLATHPNVGGAIVVGIGSEETDYTRLGREIEETGRPVETIVAKDVGGLRKAVEVGREALKRLKAEISSPPRVMIEPKDLVIGVECGGSDATSGIAANPACGCAVDRLIDVGGTALFIEVYELLGCEPYLLNRASSPSVEKRLAQAIERARRSSMAVGDFGVSPGNQEGGLTTIEEKSLGALLKGGSRQISGVVAPLESPATKGLYFVDYSQGDDGKMLSYYEDNDPEGVNSMAAAGAHMILFTTGRGSVTGSVVAPVIKICGNPEVVARMPANFDINAGKVITGKAGVEAVGDEIYERILETAQGVPTASETLGHHEYWIPPKR